MSTSITTTGSNTPVKADPKAEKYQTLRKHLEARKDEFAAIAGKTLDAERVLKVMLQHAWRTPDVLDSSADSIVRALMFCAQLKLEPVGAYGVWLVPFRNSYEVNGNWVQRLEVTPIVDYRALAALVRRSGEVGAITMRAVYERDEYDVEFGDNERIFHRPANLPADERGPVVAAYSIASLPKHGEKQRDWMWRADIDRIRGKSKAGSSKKSPWTNDYAQMAMKSSLRALCKTLPISFETREALEVADAEEMVIDGRTGEVLSAGQARIPEIGAGRLSAADAMKADIAKRRAAQEPGPAPEPSEPEPDDEGFVGTPSAGVPADGPTIVAGPAAEEPYPGGTAALRAFLDAQQEHLAAIVGKERALQAWNSSAGVESLKGIKTKAHADRRLDAAARLIQVAEVDAEISKAITKLAAKVGAATCAQLVDGIVTLKIKVFARSVKESHEALDQVLGLLETHDAT